jgi:hypothetical protein
MEGSCMWGSSFLTVVRTATFERETKKRLCAGLLPAAASLFRFY